MSSSRVFNLTLAIAASACVVATFAGCFATSETGVASRDPAMRLSAMLDAAARKDTAAIPGIVSRLESQDPGERLVAINALHRITGETLGYDHAAPRAEREKAIQRWRDRTTPP